MPLRSPKSNRGAPSLCWESLMGEVQLRLWDLPVCWMRHHPILGQFLPSEAMRINRQQNKKMEIPDILKYKYSLGFCKRTTGRPGVNSTPRVAKQLESQSLPWGPLMMTCQDITCITR